MQSVVNVNLLVLRIVSAFRTVPLGIEEQGVTLEHEAIAAANSDYSSTESVLVAN